MFEVSCAQLGVLSTSFTNGLYGNEDRMLGLFERKCEMKAAFAKQFLIPTYF